MFRTLATLLLIGSLAPAAIFAAESDTHKAGTVHATVSTVHKGTTTLANHTAVSTAKVDVHKVSSTKVEVNKFTTVHNDVHKVINTKITVDASRKFPKLNTSYVFPVSKATIARYTPRNFDKNYHVRFGTRFEHGYFFQGRNHTHWSFRCWDNRYGCCTYWCPCTSCFYYWCQPNNCFYPVTYCPCQTYVFTDCYVVPSIPEVPCESGGPQQVETGSPQQ